MSITKKDAAAARAAAAQKANAADRLSALEVERRGYVQRGNESGVQAVDDEIAKWSRIAGIPVEAGATGDETGGETGGETGDESTGDGETGDETGGETGGETGDESTGDGETGDESTGDGETVDPAPKSRGRAKAAAAAKD